MAKRDIPATNEIKLFFHCKNCLKSKPAHMSPAEYSQIECGWTVLGFQAWCKRCNLNIVHVDFEGQTHPANVSPK